MDRLDFINWVSDIIKVLQQIANCKKMRIRKTYHVICSNGNPIREVTEKYIFNIKNEWIERSLWFKCYSKWKLNMIQRIAKFSYINRTLPISLTIKDLIESLTNSYKEETGIDVVFCKEFEKSLKSKEKEDLAQKSRKTLKEQYQYLLDIADKLEKLI